MNHPALKAWFLTSLLALTPHVRGATAAAPASTAIAPASASVDDYMTYTIPPNAEKNGPIGAMDPKVVFYNYFRPGSQPSNEALIAREWYQDGKLIKREIYRNNDSIHDVRYGPQREWFTNGQLKSEQFYKGGMPNGLVRYWDEKGQLVGQYNVVNGTGIKRLYDSTGFLVDERELKNGGENGFVMTWYGGSEGQVVFSWEGQRDGTMFGFYSSGELLDLVANGRVNGPTLHFNEDGTVRSSLFRLEEEWHVGNKEVTEAEYAAAAAKDPALPPYFSDVTQYIKYFVTPEVKALFDRFRNLPRVKIPLEFDGKGNPILAPNQPGADAASLMAPPPSPPASPTRPTIQATN